MKLWLKVSLCAVVMVTLSTAACSLLLLLRSGQSNLNLAIDNALANQQIRAASWQSAMQTRTKATAKPPQGALQNILLGSLGTAVQRCFAERTLYTTQPPYHQKNICPLRRKHSNT